MKAHFYQYPLRVAKWMSTPPPSAALGLIREATDEHPTCHLGNSIAQFLHLMLHTRPGQLRSAVDFGCAIWDLEFDSGVNLAHWEEQVTKSFTAAIEQHETRLTEVRVSIAISPAGQGTQPAARWQAHIIVQGLVRFTRETFRYSTRLQIGQLTA